MTEQEALRTVVMDWRDLVAEKKETEFCDKSINDCRVGGGFKS